MWKTYNYEYLVLVPNDKIGTADSILGADRDETAAWRSALAAARNELQTNPGDVYARFNASIALYHLNDYRGSVNEFEQVEAKLPWRTLWYQIEPIQAYEKLGNYDRVFTLTDGFLNNQNRAFSELYIIRGDIYKKQGRAGLARAEYEKAVLYNRNLKPAQEALDSIPQ
jgi:tetratricopeptide (TPR) repeat protein